MKVAWLDGHPKTKWVCEFPTWDTKGWTYSRIDIFQSSFQDAPNCCSYSWPISKINAGLLLRGAEQHHSIWWYTVCPDEPWKITCSSWSLFWWVFSTPDWNQVWNTIIPLFIGFSQPWIVAVTVFGRRKQMNHEKYHQRIPIPFYRLTKIYCIYIYSLNNKINKWNSGFKKQGS